MSLSLCVSLSVCVRVCLCVVRNGEQAWRWGRRRRELYPAMRMTESTPCALHSVPPNHSQTGSVRLATYWIQDLPLLRHVRLEAHFGWNDGDGASEPL